MIILVEEVAEEISSAKVRMCDHDRIGDRLGELVHWPGTLSCLDERGKGCGCHLYSPRAGKESRLVQMSLRSSR